MINIYFDFIKEPKKIDMQFFCESVKAKISATANEQLKNERIYAYNLLKRAIGEKNGSHKEILFTDKGKPFIKDADFEISISHTGKAVCVAVGNKKPIGIDVEILNDKNEKTASSFVRRYLKEVNIKTKKPEEKFLFFGIENIYECEESSNLLKWTAIEAVLKAVGDGFSSLPDIESYIDGYQIYSGKIMHENEIYVFSVAEEK